MGWVSSLSNFSFHFFLLIVFSSNETWHSSLSFPSNFFLLSCFLAKIQNIECRSWIPFLFSLSIPSFMMCFLTINYGIVLFLFLFPFLPFLVVFSCNKI